MAWLGVTACGGAERPAPSVAPPATKGGKARLATATPAGDRALTRRAPLRYDIRGRPFPLPIVSGTIAGQPVLMLVDTGANSHVVAGWLARKLSLPMKKLGDIGTDHVGRSIATYRIDKVEMAIDDWGPLSTTTALATEVPDVIERLGIGAFISPQRLDEEGDAVVLDLAKGEVRAAWWDDAHEELSAGGAALVRPDQARACEENDGPVKGLAFVVPATIDSQKVQLLVDTGAQRSDVFATSTAGQRLASRSAPNKEAMYTASGKVSARRLKGALVAAGEVAVTADVDLIQGAADSSCPRDGVLAMDVLRSCALLFGRSRIHGRCLPPK
ncbi:MAG: aspartyl protease family protein [Labilithrix sp.]|nr:aspartyl protease family protein [Labilithrix sp.]MCW5836704.1 aspartyl protease family protein [Labilithrix sp.]